MPYVDLNTIHNPATGTAAPATWGDQVRDNGEFLIDPPACSVFHSVSVSIATATPTFLAANSELYDNNGMHSTVTNNSRITAVTAGRYLVIGSMEYASSATGYRSIAIRANGTDIYEGTTVPAVSGAVTRISMARTVVLAANDYVEAQAYQASGGNLNVLLMEFSAMFLTR